MRILSRKWLVGFAGLVAAQMSPTAYSENLMSVYQLALENDKELSAARNENEAALQAGRQLTGLYYPSMDLGFDHLETNQVINRSENDVFGSGESDFPTDVLTLSLNQPVFRWDYFSQRKVAKAEISQADYVLAAQEQNLMLRTAESYLLTLAAWDNELVTKAERDAVAEQLKLAEKRLEVGLAHPTEVHESLARFQFNESEVIVAENQVIDQEEGLRVIVGRSVTNLQPLKDTFEMVKPDPAEEATWISAAIDNNLTVKARQAAADVAIAEYEVQKADRYPTVDFVARFNNRDSGGSLFGGGSDVDTTDLILRANWKVFQGGILRARIKEALYFKQRAEDNLALEQAKVRREARKAYRAVVSAIAKSKALKTSMEAQQQAVQAKIKGFETGANSNIDVLDAKRDFFFVQRDYLKSRYEYLLGMLNLKMQVGSLSPEDLQMVNGMLRAEGSAKVTPQADFPAVMISSITETAESANAMGRPDALIKNLVSVEEKRCGVISAELENIEQSVRRLCADAEWNTMTDQGIQNIALRNNTASDPEA